jgi:PAS domain S-box-containing protein
MLKIGSHKPAHPYKIRLVAVRRRKQNRNATSTGPTSPKGRRQAGPGADSLPPIDYRAVFEHAPDAILVVDDQGRYIDANPAACALTGYARPELLKKRIGDLTVPQERSRSIERFELLQRTGRTRRDRVLQRKDGTQIPVEAHAIRLDDGTCFTILRDITERLAAHDTLQRSLDAYSTLVDLCHAAVISAGTDGRIASWNPAAQFLFGYSAEEAIGMSLTKLIPPGLRRNHLSAFRRHAASQGERFARTFTTRGMRKNGKELPIEVSAAVGEQDGQPLFTAVVRDISEHQDVVERLNDALQRLQFHIERMPLAYIVWDTDFRVVEWNPTAERMFGYSRDEAIGRHAYDLIVPRDVTEAVDVVWADLLQGDTSSHSLNANVRKDGSRLTCDWFNTPLRDSAGRIRGVASMAMDVSEREAVEARIRDAQKLESLGIMAGGIAHDFNSSLMVILGNTALLRSIERLPPKAIEHIELIEEAGSRADQLIKHLMAYARSGRYNPHATDLNEVIRECTPFVQSSVGRRHQIKLGLAEQIPPIFADRSQLEQIVLNLCLNASQAMSGRGAIDVETREVELTVADVARCAPYDARPGRYVEMAVADTGSGMDEATAARIFDPFFTTKAQGHGLGLAAVLGILRRHNACARVDSTPGKGTKAHVFFPVHREEPAEKGKRASGRRPKSSGASRRTTRRKRT